MRFPARRSIPKQRGVILLLVLIVLVVMMVSSLALVRSVDTGNLIAGNLSFRQGAVQGVEPGIETARAWLAANKTSLNGSSVGNGYYALDQLVDYTGNSNYTNRAEIDWDGSSTAPVKARVIPEDARTKNTVAYVIHRLCSQVGGINDPGQSCAASTGSAVGSTQGAADYANRPLSTKQNIYYRVTLRVAGPKNTFSFVQAMLLN